MFLAKLFSFKQLLNLSTTKTSDLTMESPEDLSYKPVSINLQFLCSFLFVITSVLCLIYIIAYLEFA